MPGPPRVLLVEDSAARSELLRSWIPSAIRVVWAKSGGEAVGILRRDPPATYAGIMLDHDLGQQLRDPSGKQLTGADVARLIAERVPTDTPILVHSMNPARRGDILAILVDAGFEVTQIPMASLDANKLQVWLTTVESVHEERREDGA
jgi:CheY-like chemotaxis protein